METRVEENVHTSAMVFAAIESQRTGLPVRLAEFMQRAERELATEAT
jgi:hypothetical protein